MLKDPVARPLPQSLRVLRGSSRDDAQFLLHHASRRNLSAGKFDVRVGFRVVCP